MKIFLQEYYFFFFGTMCKETMVSIYLPMQYQMLFLLG
jgi:hypothetical protein